MMHLPRNRVPLRVLANAERLFTTEWFHAYLLITLGALIMAAGYVYFIVPYKIVPGGVYGIGVILYHTLGWPTGLTGLVINIPLIIVGTKVLGPRFGVKTVVGLVLTSGLIDLLTHFWGDTPLINDPLLSTIVGGVLVGAGMGLVFRAKATSGGSDIVAQLVSRATQVPVGQVMIYVASSIVGVAILIFRDYTLALYAIVCIFVSGRVLDQVLTGANYMKAVTIITSHPKQISDLLMYRLNRGGTCLQGRSMYHGTEKQVIFTAVSRRELAILEDQVRQIDPEAFLTVVNSSDLIGEGFRPIDQAA